MSEAVKTSEPDCTCSPDQPHHDDDCPQRQYLLSRRPPADAPPLPFVMFRVDGGGGDETWVRLDRIESVSGHPVVVTTMSGHQIEDSGTVDDMIDRMREVYGEAQKYSGS